MKNNKGFSLVELIIVIAIMAILAAAIAPALVRYIDKSRRADDLALCETVGKAVLLTINSGDADVGGVDTDLYELWVSNSFSNTRYSVSVDGGPQYQVENIAYWQNGQNGDIFVHGGATDVQPFVDAVNTNLGTPQAKLLKNTKDPAGSTNHLDTIYVMKHVATSEIEVWVGYGGGGTTGTPLYMLYPNPCSYYR